jgi:hypothetical protein
MTEKELAELYYGGANAKGTETTTTLKRGRFVATVKAAPTTGTTEAVAEALDSSETVVSDKQKVDDETSWSVRVKRMQAIRRRIMLLGMAKLPIPDALRAELAELEKAPSA